MATEKNNKRITISFKDSIRDKELYKNLMGLDDRGATIKNILEDLEGLIKIDSEPKMEGRQMMMVVSPEK